jgi:hypothetical protein
MTEQLGLDQIFGQRCAVHRHQRAGPARRQMMEPLGDQLLAGAAFADYQDRAIERRGAAGALDRVEKRKALPDELVRPLHRFSPKNWPTVGGKPHLLARYFDRGSGEKLRFSPVSGVFWMLAHLLNGKEQVTGPDFEFGVME